MPRRGAPLPLCSNVGSSAKLTPASSTSSMSVAAGSAKSAAAARKEVLAAEARKLKNEIAARSGSLQAARSSSLVSAASSSASLASATGRAKEVGGRVPAGTGRASALEGLARSLPSNPEPAGDARHRELGCSGCSHWFHCSSRGRCSCAAGQDSGRVSGRAAGRPGPRHQQRQPAAAGGQRLGRQEPRQLRVQPGHRGRGGAQGAWGRRRPPGQLWLALIFAGPAPLLYPVFALFCLLWQRTHGIPALGCCAGRGLAAQPRCRLPASACG